MGADDGFKIRHRRLLAHQSGKAFLFQDALYDANAVRPFGMADRRLMIERGRMAQVQGRHAGRRASGSTATQWQLRVPLSNVVATQHNCRQRRGSVVAESPLL